MIFPLVSTLVDSLTFIMELAMAPNTDLNLMPYPQTVELNKGQVTVDSEFKVFIKGYNSDRVEYTAKRFIDRLERQTGVPTLNWQTENEKEANLVIDIKRAPKTEVQNIESDESYKIETKGDQITLSSESPYGAMRGIETVLQLVEATSTGYHIPAVTIVDEPRFQWRGVSYDTSRHFIEFDVLIRQLDAMASAKMNVFHWHFWDDQGIRIQTDSWTRLWSESSDGNYYTKDQVRYLVEYARNLGIRVIPEVSLPGHSSAVAHAYPHLMSGGEGQAYEQEREWGVFEPLMDPLNPELYEMLGDVFDEMVALFPDEYFHIGGDEPNYSQWINIDKHQAFIADNNLDGERGLQSYLNIKVEKMLEARGKKMTGWDEIWHKDLPTSIVIQSWQGHDSIGRAAKEGYQGILSTGYYLDQPQPTSYHYRNDPIPKGITVDDSLHAGESFVSYQWKKPCTKGGPRKGLLTIIEATDGTPRAFVDYNGKPREEVFIKKYQAGETLVAHFDNFMSYTEFNLNLNQNGFAEGSYQLIGNVRWPTTGEVIASSSLEGSVIPKPDGGYPAELTEKEKALILGGEITIWLENKDTHTVESYLWPRSYAIAERLWSDASITDEESMYERMAVMDTWSEVSVGLRHHANADMLLKRLAKGQDIQPLQALARYMEPAQYYARNWEKWISTENNGDLYNQHERLNRFVDALVVESYAVRDMEKLVADYAMGNSTALVDLEMHFKNVREAAIASQPIFADHVAAVDSVIMAEKAELIAELGLTLIEKAKKGDTIRGADAQAYLAVIDESAKIYDEAIVAIVRPTEALVRQLSR
ncbi:family 20 glycosylhydrolase [Vibrio genomosp. F10 str. 9ZC157]|uniref:beta-N-acetylhexosaminidase n=1 Tax=Vibrio genomosp. F10 str. ZF-129 TaxID=1187848 RepID=A0A1E5BEQ3_9VIBR|nr:family 20 glycosylhydrolase [Vibrio genomosp. F10]OEE33375.1 beta-N-acetylhexosaminidase [Vibrio genomosp. F10 str. ZF-129]OEE93738.1 beta-N-acetylhexosaminidase [Vibrio genomosp. F10 str. 9ZC157]